ncbi:opioid growth factor receptor-like [Anarrhichthys ocellatus]|uniref:opioid growth factor receptor-like n=1 Tax=Anarrhichthys ocellatus TaxID=433405 RepID=UPI0012EEA33D|nr:opioid growth factor receptor-like [Anarrhichthys ocellatus]
MAMFNFNLLYSAYGWFRRTMCFFWRFTKRIFNPIYEYLFVRIPWRKGTGSQAELEVNAEDIPTERRFSDQDEESHSPEGQHEAACRERTADSHRELTCKRPRFEEDGDEYRVEPTDELYCGYDSTWETEEPQRGKVTRTKRPAVYNYMFDRFENAAKDMQNYRHDYPSPVRQQRRNQVSDAKPNLQFYLGMKCSVPDGVYIDGFHTDWYGQYNSLESVHSYIQWLFPLQEPGMNYEASTLTKEEITEFCQSNTAKANLVKSYKLMLDFYGIELCDEETGEVKRAFNWRDRFNNLNSRLHNNLRITRILKCLGTLGYRHYQAPLVRFFLEETLVHGQLPDVKISVLNYFLFAVLDKRERRSLIKFAYFRYDRKEEFVWCPKKIQTIWSQQGI